MIPTDFDQRLAHFGTNRKEPPLRTPYWKFFVKAIDDFMLKLLLVCACVDIGFEVGFSTPDERATGKLLTLFLGCHLLCAARAVSFLTKYYNLKM